MVNKCEEIVESLSRDPNGWALSLFSKGFISDAVLDQTNELNITKNNKALTLYSALLKVVEQYPERYYDFISLLQEKGNLYDDLRDFLSKNYSGES